MTLQYDRDMTTWHDMTRIWRGCHLTTRWPVSSGGGGPRLATSLRMLRSGYSGDSGKCKCCLIFESFAQSQYHMRVIDGAPRRISNATMWIMWIRLMSPIVIVALLCSCIVLFWLCSKYCCCSIYILHLMLCWSEVVINPRMRFAVIVSWQFRNYFATMCRWIYSLCNEVIPFYILYRAEHQGTNKFHY